MATLNTRDPVQGLVDYVLDMKPYHTKILEVWVEYIYSDAVDGTVMDMMDTIMSIDFDRHNPACEHGFGLVSWNMMLSGISPSELPTEVISYPGGTISLIEAAHLYYMYIVALRRGEVRYDLENPSYLDDGSPFALLRYDEVRVPAQAYFSSLATAAQFWYDPSTHKVYSKSNGSWVEQPVYISPFPPGTPQEMDLWFNIHAETLHRYTGGAWAEVLGVYIARSDPRFALEYPRALSSNWDKAPCPGPFGGTHVYAYIKDELALEHGSEVFLFDSVRTMVFDPTDELSSNNNQDRYDYPITLRRVVTQEPDGTYKVTIQEVSVITDPENPTVQSGRRIVNVGGYEFAGFGLSRQKKGVRTTEYISWRHTAQGTKLVYDTIFNRDTFGFKVEGSALIAQTITSGTRTDVDCPFVDGAVVYFTSTDDLPSYTLVGRDADRTAAHNAQFEGPWYGSGATRDWSVRPTLMLERYKPYRIKWLDLNPETNGAATFSVIALNDDYTIDEGSMGDDSYITFTGTGRGSLLFGLGHPVPFIEVRQHLTDTTNATITGAVSSATDSVMGSRYVEIKDVLLGYDDNGTTRNGFVVDGNYSALKSGELLKVASPLQGSNSGEWYVSNASVWSNAWIGVDGGGALIPAPAPSWWNELIMGLWPAPVRKSPSEIQQLHDSGTYVDQTSEYNYYYVTTIGVRGVAPSQQFPFGYVVFNYYSFAEASGDASVAKTTVSDKLTFGSCHYVTLGDGSITQVWDAGIPGTRIVLTDAVYGQMQEMILPTNEYGVPTIGSFDIHYYDIGGYDEPTSTD